MRFIVEVPGYLKVELNAPDAATAAASAEMFAEKASQNPSTMHLASQEGVFLGAGFVTLPPEEEDRQPDVYVCRGGKLTAVNEEGWLEPLDEAC